MHKKYFILGALVIILVGISLITRSHLKVKSDESIAWEGTWKTGSEKDGFTTRAELNIEPVNDNSFDFSISSLWGYVDKGPNIGNLSGHAIITSSTAVATIGTDEDETCQISFSNNGGKEIVVTTTNDDCEFYRGMNVSFAGTYVPAK